MADSGADLVSALELVYEAEDQLSKKYPDHELISYLKIADEKERDAEWQKLLRRYSRNPKAEGNVQGDSECNYALVRYFIALEVALGKREAPQSQGVE
jgi:hypothetical protein